MKKYKLLLIAVTMLMAFKLFHKDKPTLYLIGDSTVANGSGNDGLWGWGKYLCKFIDTNRINIRNYAQGGTSARTFQTNGIWDKKLNKIGMWDTVYSKLKKGDYLIIQFGINDQSPVDDSTRSRGTLHGLGDDSLLIFNKVTKMPEIVHTFGWYMRRFILLAKEKGVTVIVCSAIAKNKWQDGKVLRGESGFCEWALQSARQTDAFAIDLNTLIADMYDQEGREAVTLKYHFTKDDTHTTEAGAILNASLVAKGIEGLNKCGLRKYLLK